MRSNVNLNGQDILHWYKSTGINYTESGFPILAPLGGIETGIKTMQFSFVKTAKDKDVYLHFYMHDFLFERIWNNPDRYITLIQKFKGMFMPDFSVFWDMPLPLQKFNYYRSLWFAAYAQQHGIKVIPSAIWSDENSYDWCFGGMPKNDVVCISAVGCMKESTNKILFYKGLSECMNQLQPKIVLLRISAKSYQEVKRYIENLLPNAEIRLVDYVV